MSINIQIQQTHFNSEIKQTINARDLHSNLESKQEFSHWIRNRLTDFEENLDYISLDKIIERENGATKRIEYFITIDTAKQLAMIERNDKGREVRKYFIEMEKVALSSTAKLPQNYLQALEALVESEKEKLLLISENQQKQSIIEDFITIDENKNYTEVAKLLHKKPREFISMLKSEKYIRLNREPYQKYIDSNHFVIKYKKGIRREEDGRCIEIEDKSFPAYLITPKGFEYFVKKLK